MVDDGPLGGTGAKAHCHLVECALHVVGGSQRLPVDPEDAEAALIGRTRHAREDVLGRECNPHNQQFLASAVDQRANPVTGFELATDGKAFGHQRFDGPRVMPLDHAPAAQVYLVQALGCPRVKPNQATNDGIRHVRYGDRHHLAQRGLHVGCAGNALKLAFQRERRPFERGKHIGKTGIGVIQIARPRQRLKSAETGNEARHAAGDHQRDGQGLAPHQAQIAQQLAVKRFKRESFTKTAPTV